MVENRRYLTYEDQCEARIETEVVKVLTSEVDHALKEVFNEGKVILEDDNSEWGDLSLLSRPYTFKRGKSFVRL